MGEREVEKGSVWSLPGCAASPATSGSESSAARCATCAHWRFEEPDWQFESLRFGICKAIRQREDIIESARSIEDWDDREAEEHQLLSQARAIAVDGSGYYAALRTAADFGCVLHEPADAPEASPQQVEGEGSISGGSGA